jgi:ABC-2 type transport system permease protein
MTVATDTASATGLPAGAGAPGPVPARGFARWRLVVEAEWIKLRSLRSTRIALLAVFVVTVGIAAIAGAVTAAHWSSMAPKDKVGFDPTSLSLNGWFLGQLVVGVLGVLVVTSEYSSRMIRTTFTAVPRRRHVLAAKALVVGVVVLVVALVTSSVAFGLGQGLLSTTGRAVSLGDPGELRAVVGAGLYATVITLLGLGLGAIVRSTAGSVSALFGVLFVPPILAEAFPSGWHQTIQRYSPMNAGSRVLMVHSESNALGPWLGLGVFALDAAVVLAVAFWLVARRDA